MRYKITFQLNGYKFPLNYRETLMSFLKSSLADYENGQYFKKFYDECTAKSFSFAVRLPKCTFQNDYIELSEKVFDLFLTINNLTDAVIIYNAFNQQRYKHFPLPLGNTCTLVKIIMENEKDIVNSEIICQLAMPLLVRVHNSDNRDQYLIYSDEDFSLKLKDIVIAQLESFNMDKSLANEFACEAVNCKKTVVKYKGGFLTGTLGIIKLLGSPLLLKFLYESGIGSKRSAGFGYLNIIR